MTTTSTSIISHKNKDTQIAQKTLVPTSPKMRSLLKELKDDINRFHDKINSESIKFSGIYGRRVKQIAKQGIEDNLTKEQIRAHIDATVGDSLSQRQIRKILPLELKYPEKIRTKSRDENLRNSSAQLELTERAPTIEYDSKIKEIDNEMIGKLQELELEAQQPQLSLSNFNPTLIPTYDREFLVQLSEYLYQENLRLREEINNLQQIGKVEITSIPKEEFISSQNNTPKPRRNERIFASLEEVQKYCRKHELTSKRQYQDACKKKDFPESFPRSRADEHFGISWNIVLGKE